MKTSHFRSSGLRRASLNALPDTGCTVLSALSGVSGLQNEDPKPDDAPCDRRVQTQEDVSYTEATAYIDQGRRRSAPSLVGPLQSRASKGGPESTWHVLLLAGRTLKKKTPEQVASGLAEVLKMDMGEAKSKIAAAKTATTVVVGNGADCKDAFLIAERLRDKGFFRPGHFRYGTSISPQASSAISGAIQFCSPIVSPATGVY